MAKVTLKSFDELIIPEDKAQALLAMIDEHRDSHLGLGAYPITIEHANGLWVGSLASISTISMSDKQKVRKHSFKNEEDLKRFHDEYGYGAFEPRYEPGFGMIDVRTQFLIKTSQAKIVNDHLLMLNSPHREKWDDLWSFYESKLDPFNDLC